MMTTTAAAMRAPIGVKTAPTIAALISKTIPRSNQKHRQMHSQKPYPPKRRPPIKSFAATNKADSHQTLLPISLVQPESKRPR